MTRGKPGEGDPGPGLTSAMAELMALARGVGLKAALDPVFADFLSACRDYSRLENLVLSSTPLQFPAHLLLGGLADGDPIKQGLTLAARERRRLNRRPGAVPDLAALIEGQGVKVVERPFPPGTGAFGAFVFDARLGPAILTDSNLSRPARELAIIHEFGHYLADNNPFRTFLCLWDATGDSAELRASAFASDFLVPGSDLEDYLRASNLRKGDPMTGGILDQLRAYFEADDRAIIDRLLIGGWIDRSDVEQLAGGQGNREEPETGGGPSARFLSLAVLAHRGGHISLSELARLLGVDEATARRTEATFFHVGRRREKVGRPARREAGGARRPEEDDGHGSD